MNVQADLNIRWALMSKGTFSDVAAHFNKSLLQVPVVTGRKPKSSRDPVSILHKSVAGRYRSITYPDGSITARYRFIKNASWGMPFVITYHPDLSNPRGIINTYWSIVSSSVRLNCIPL